MKHIDKLWKKISLISINSEKYNNNYLDSIYNFHVSYNNLINFNYYPCKINAIFFQIFKWFYNNNRKLTDINFYNFKEFMYHNKSVYKYCIDIFL